MNEDAFEDEVHEALDLVLVSFELQRVAVYMFEDDDGRDRTSLRLVVSVSSRSAARRALDFCRSASYCR